jgi:hypothetical protein
MAKISAAMSSIIRSAMWSALVVQQGPDPVRGKDDDIAAVATRSTFGPPTRLSPLPLERSHSRATVAGTEMDEDLIYEHCTPSREGLRR